jgi:5-methylcytosine-specific restriction endonuclease McrA
MRPVDAVALLNSTPLGAVIGERQLHRHRSRAGDGVRVGRRINFLAYVAWLCRQRHTPAPRTDQAVSYKDILELLKAQDYRCALSGWPLTPETAALDHVLAISRGGPHARCNLQVLHRDVNRAKHTLTNEEFVRLCRAVVEHTAHRANVGDAGTAAGRSVRGGGPATARGQTSRPGGRPGGGGSARHPRQGGLNDAKR